MYNYSEYKTYYKDHSFEFGYSVLKNEPLPRFLHNMEIKAFLEYRKINKVELQHYFFEKINECEKKASLESEQEYLNKLKYLSDCIF